MYRQVNKRTPPDFHECWPSMKIKCYWIFLWQQVQGSDRYQHSAMGTLENWHFSNSAQLQYRGNILWGQQCALDSVVNGSPATWLLPPVSLLVLPQNLYHFCKKRDVTPSVLNESVSSCELNYKYEKSSCCCFYSSRFVSVARWPNSRLV